MHSQESYPLPEDPALAQVAAVLRDAEHWAWTEKARRDAPAVAVCEVQTRLRRLGHPVRRALRSDSTRPSRRCGHCSRECLVQRGRATYRVPSDVELAPAPQHRIPLWIGSWGSNAGLRRVARAGDGWLASAYNTTPDGFAEARDHLARELEDRGRDSEGFPNGLATMWTWVAKDRAEGDRVLGDVLAPLLNRDPDELRGQLCIGTAEHCAGVLSSYAAAGCQRVYLWPLGEEQRQIELVASEVAPRIERP